MKLRQQVAVAPGVVRKGLIQVLPDERGHVQPDDIQQSERRALGQADQRTSERVHFLHRISVLDDDLGDGAQQEKSNAIANEVRRVSARHHSLAQPVIGESRNKMEQRRIGLRSRNYFQKMQIPWRVEEMRAQK